jgi:lipopolysaccharide export system protein LptA
MKALSIGMIAASVLAAGAASAQEWRPDPNAPLDISASESGVFNNENCTSVWKGSVRVVQGRARLMSQTMTTRAPKRAGKCGDTNKLELERNVFYVTPDAVVRADHALYDRDADTVLFTGDVIVTRGKDVSTGTKLTVNLKTNDTTMEGPVRAFIQPKTN